MDSDVESRADQQPLFLSPGSGDDDLSLVKAASALVRQLPLILGCAVVLVLGVLAFLLVTGFDYVAESSFRPESSEQARSGQISSLAAQFGMSLGAGQGDNVEFYQQLLRARHLLRAAAETDYAFQVGASTDSLRGTLADLLDVEGDTEEARIRNAALELRESLAVEANTQSNVVTVRTTMPWPDLAVLVNRRLLDLVNDFNLRNRQSRAAAEREFVAARLEQVRGELLSAESELQRFYEANRRYEQSPELRFEAARLQRIVDLRQQVYTSLAVAAEEARINEVRNTPLITVIDPPEGFVRRTGSYVRIGAVALIFGLLLGVFLGLVREYVRWQAASNPSDVAELRRTLHGKLARWRDRVRPGTDGA